MNVDATRDIGPFAGPHSADPLICSSSLPTSTGEMAAADVARPRDLLAEADELLGKGGGDGPAPAPTPPSPRPAGGTRLYIARLLHGPYMLAAAGLKPAALNPSPRPAPNASPRPAPKQGGNMDCMNNARAFRRPLFIYRY
jgi:hypothetical protein